MIGGTGTTTTSVLGLSSLVLLRLLNSCSHIDAAGQDTVNLPDAPASAIAGEDAAAVEVGDDVLDAHLAGGAVAFQREAIDEAHRVGVERIDLQLLLDLGYALFGGDGAIADRGKRAVPEVLPRVFLQCKSAWNS
jgi:hypothetical protein